LIKIKKYNLYNSYIISGDLKESLEDYKGAVNDYTKALEIDSTDSGVYLKRGLQYKYMNLLDKACEDFNKAKLMGNQNAIYYIDNCK